jgi:hypothetical protein
VPELMRVLGEIGVLPSAARPRVGTGGDSAGGDSAGGDGAAA